MTRSTRLILIAVASLACMIVGYDLMRRTKPAEPAVSRGATPSADVPASGAETGSTMLYAHNLRLRQGPRFRVSIRWIRGQMLRTRPTVNPSLDDLESFVLQIDKGVVRVAIKEVVGFLNSVSVADAPLKDVSMTSNGDTVTLQGTVHKILPLPVSLSGRLSPMADGRVRFGVEKIDVLKIPLKGLLGQFHVELRDVVRTGDLPGLEIVGNNVLFDTQRLLPAPHIKGQITSLRVIGPEIEVVYGGAGNDETKLSQWHNFLKLTGGTLGFGKLTMRDTDLTMIDATQAEWFDLDLAHYQAQVVNGTTRVTRAAGLEVFMLGPDAKASDAISMDWLKNRGAALPADIPVKQ